MMLYMHRVQLLGLNNGLPFTTFSFTVSSSRSITDNGKELVVETSFLLEDMEDILLLLSRDDIPPPTANNTVLLLATNSHPFVNDLGKAPV